MVRACPPSGLRSRLSLTPTGAWAWNPLRLPASLKPCEVCQDKIGVSQKQARPLDADALSAIRATALNPRKARGGSLEMEETALRRGRLDIALASVLSDAGLRISEAASLRWRDVLDAEDGAGLVYIERSKTDQAGEGAYVVVTPDTLAALKQLREDSEAWTDNEPVFRTINVSDKSPRGQYGEGRWDWAKGTRVIRDEWGWPSG